MWVFCVLLKLRIPDCILIFGLVVVWTACAVRYTISGVSWCIPTTL